MGPIQTLPELLGALRRRARLIVLLTALGAALGVLAALSSERVYSATAVIQVLNPVIEDEDAAASVTLVRRLQQIEQQLMSRENLLAMADRYGMFPGHVANPTERMALMRQSISMTSIAAAQVEFRRDGAISALVVTVTVSDPQAAAGIANEIADTLVRESASERQNRLSQALRFFQQEEERLQEMISTLGNEIITFQTSNEALLPGALTLRREELRRLEESRLMIERDMVQYRNELATLDPSSTRAVTQRRIAQLNEEIATRNGEMALLDERINAISTLLARAPEIEGQGAAMEQRMTQLQEQLSATSQRRRDTEVEQRIEADSQSERFELLEAALVPEYPVSRSRKSIAVLGTVAGLMAGLVLAYLAEMANPVLRTSAQFERVLGLRPVISIPLGAAQPRTGRRRYILLMGLTVILLGAMWFAARMI